MVTALQGGAKCGRYSVSLFETITEYQPMGAKAMIEPTEIVVPKSNDAEIITAVDDYVRGLRGTATNV